MGFNATLYRIYRVEVGCEEKMMASNSPHLPEIPRGNLPSWPRGHIKPSLQPVPLSKDKFQSLQSAQRSSCSSSSSTSRTPSRGSGPPSVVPERKHSVKLPPVPGARGADSRATQLEKDMTFLKSHHRDTLIKLHEEVERLKRRNKGESGTSGQPRVLLYVCVCVCV